MKTYGFLIILCWALYSWIGSLSTATARVGMGDTHDSDAAESRVRRVEENETDNPGQFLLGFGILFGDDLLATRKLNNGGNFTLSYEMRHFKMHAEIGGFFENSSGESMFRFGVGASYLLLNRQWSPYFGANISYLHLKMNTVPGVRHENRGMGMSIHAGLELFRFHSTRMLFELGCLLPFFSLQGNNHLTETYSLLGYGMLSFLW